MRLFLAVDPDDAAIAQLASRLRRLQRAAGDTSGALRWMAAADIHATLHFLGALDAETVARLRETLDAPIPVPSFQMTIGDAGVFPAVGPPRVVWLAVVRGGDALATLHRVLAERINLAAVTLEDRPFAPHVTVGRVRDRERHRVVQLRQRLEAAQTDPISWTVDHVTLFRSDLSGKGPRYQAIQVMPLEL